MAPSEFWRMSPSEWWWYYEAKLPPEMKKPKTDWRGMIDQLKAAEKMKNGRKHNADSGRKCFTVADRFGTWR
jgi:hypothetical protein